MTETKAAQAGGLGLCRHCGHARGYHYHPQARCSDRECPCPGYESRNPPGRDRPAGVRAMPSQTGETKPAYVKMYAIWAGDIFVAYSGFSCIAGGTLVRIERDEIGLYFACADGKHYVESQRDANNECLGLTRAPLA